MDRLKISTFICVSSFPLEIAVRIAISDDTQLNARKQSELLLSSLYEKVCLLADFFDRLTSG